ncbi:RidA family protein [Colwellia demingiae]|uniref:RidA family protein n=2 Tax=Colwellia demingiae TaxID=89401 RepID=A0A5C6Q5M9_9GAMM|nr:RidA family protein [Colwellia demingiae]
MMSIQRKNYNKLGEVLGPYTQSVIHSNTLYTSGLTAFGSSAQMAGIEVQTRTIFSQLNHICQAHNVTMKNLIKVTIFVSDFSDMDLLRSTLFDLYGHDIPASSLIKVDALFSKDFKIEIEAIIGL